MKKENRYQRSIRWLYQYALFFMIVAFVVSCCMTLFLTTLSGSLPLEFTEENINKAAKLTFGNVLLLSVLFTLVDALRRQFTTHRAAKYIADAAKKVVLGDFSVRIAPMKWFAADEEFNELIDCFNKMAEELAGVETLRTDFIANVSHEMKTPLAVIQNYGTLLQAPDLEAEKRMEYAKGVTEGARRLGDMMTNILKLNRLEKQQIYPKQEEYDLGEQLCECLLAYETVWEGKQIEIEVNIAQEVRVHTDRELLDLVWNNLFSNAFKFTQRGGTVEVSLTMEGSDAVVQVRDTGCGMSAEVGAHIFEKFYQGDTSHATQGNGLGLALVKRVVDILHGEISVESMLGEGSVFTVRFCTKKNGTE